MQCFPVKFHLRGKWSLQGTGLSPTLSPRLVEWMEADRSIGCPFSQHGSYQPCGALGDLTVWLVRLGNVNPSPSPSQVSTLGRNHRQLEPRTTQLSLCLQLLSRRVCCIFVNYTPALSTRSTCIPSRTLDLPEAPGTPAAVPSHREPKAE